MLFTMNEPIWFHPSTIDFRKQMDGLIMLVSDQLTLNPISGVHHQQAIHEIIEQRREVVACVNGCDGEIVTVPALLLHRITTTLNC